MGVQGRHNFLNPLLAVPHLVQEFFIHQPRFEDDESMVGGIMVSFEEGLIKRLSNLLTIPIEEDCVINWDELGVSQKEMEHVICAGVNHRYLTSM